MLHCVDGREVYMYAGSRIVRRALGHTADIFADCVIVIPELPCDEEEQHRLQNIPTTERQHQRSVAVSYGSSSFGVSITGLGITTCERLDLYRWSFLVQTTFNILTIPIPSY
ncbi:hypothetical protein PGT21_021191 [Puccinia graminis f. sp. tritici]|uniref:Uncharacterized protein n=1 Tax=Puccinia graminis f. sp. tritici TaxID=56615 RepID=A0A5B0RE77_PUCGR|nr:hypothetical protein PGT21_021191 [Puccinia graminis f. sp. tritici]KAA1124121.1 hypothetical protein PGTUg99_028465 [Puccinia graminis f. sp. tritici]